MIRFLFRFIGLWILAAGFVALIRDGTAAIAAPNSFDVSKLVKFGDDWTNIHAASLNSLKALIERHLGPTVLEFVSLYILNLPTWLVLGILGSILILIGRKKRALIGYGRD